MNHLNPLVSIIIPLYNRVTLVNETIASVLNQSYINWECIVVDDGSSDGSFELVEQLKQTDNRIRLFRRTIALKGAPVCRNIGLEKSSGTYIIYLDSDDLLAPFCLEKRVHHFLQYNDLDFLVFPMLVFKDQPYDLNLLWNRENKEEDLDRFLRMDALWQTTGPLYKRTVLIAEKGFREELAFWQDYDLHLRLVLKGYRYRKFLSAEPDCFYRGHYDNRVSICNPFVKDDTMLDKEVGFFTWQLKFLKSENIQLDKKHRVVLWHVLNSLVSRYLLEKNKPVTYIKKWFQAGRLLEVGWYNHSITFLYQFTCWLAKKSSFFIRFRTAWQQVFKNRIADGDILTNNAIGRIKYTATQSINS